MKKTLLLLLLLPIFGFAQVDLVKWDAANTNRNTPTYVNTLYPTPGVADFTTSGVQTPTYNTNWEAPNSFFIIGGWPTYQENEGSYDTNKYIEFKITPTAGNKIDLSIFKFTYRTQGGSSEKFQIQYSKDKNFTKNVKVLVPETIISTSWTTINPAFSPEINPVLPEEIVYVRVYVYNSSNNNFHFITSTSSTNKPPTIVGTISPFDSNKILAINDYLDTTKGVGLNISPLSNDVKKENVTTITISTPPLASQGSAILNPDKTITFNPAKNFTGKATFKYTISDGTNSSEGSIEVNVADVSSGSLVIWNAKTSSDLYKPTVNSSWVTAANVSRIGTNTTITYNNNEDVINPFYSTTSWPNTNAIDQTKYVEFKMTADANHKVDLSTFGFIYRVQGGNTQKIRISYSKNSTPSTTDKVLLADSVTPTTWTTITPAFASDLNTLLAGETVYIRVYIYNSNDAFQFRTKTAINGSVKDTNTLLANNDDISTPVNQPITVPILTNDVIGGSAIQLITVTQPTNGTVTVNGTSSVTFTPSSAFTGTTSFTYTLRDANSNYSSATVGVLGTAAVCAASNVAGNNYWKGYVYTYTGNTPATTTYVGSVAEKPLFDRNIGDGTITGDASVEANAFCGTAPSDKFFVRYLMKATTTAGTYNITLGADDGVRLYIDGTLVPMTGTSWSDHSYLSYSTQYTFSAGSHDFVLEYYENAGASRVSFSYGLIKGDPTVFGTNVWNVYGYTTANFNLPATSYVGTYVDSNLNVDTTKYWAKEKSPSSGAGWDGAPMPIDNFTISYKRKGFPCGSYNIQVVNCDDDIQIYIDGVATPTYTAGGNINNPVIINNNAVYTLNKDSKVEIRLREDAGDAKMAINFIDVPVTYNGTGTVSANTSIIITNDVTLNNNVEVCSCTVNAGKTLTVPLNKILVVNENITVGTGGKLLVQNGGSLVQTNKNAVYTGANNSFELQRATASVRKYDYTYWSSPVTGFALNSLIANTQYNRFDPANGWASMGNGAAAMTPGVGYSVLAPQTNSLTVGSVYNASFVGVPNNGDVNVNPGATLWNLIGNPYPSALDATKFITENAPSTNPTIEGTLYFWTHNTSPANTDPNKENIYYYTTDDYAVFNLSGSVATSAAKSEPNASSNVPTGNISSGQGFFVKALTSAPIKFNNDMRVKGSSNNTQFFKTSENEAKDRLWVNFANKNGAFKQILVGYFDGATNSWDNNYDAVTFSVNPYVDFYSINETKELVIQGRALPFENTDQIPLGYGTTIEGEFTIAIDHAEGLFDNQTVYLEDKTAGVIHDLTASDYTFNAIKGNFADRFVLRYTNKTLGTGDFENLENGILVSVKNKTISVLSSKENIKEVTIYYISGKLLYNKKKVSNTELQVQNLPLSNQVLLVKVTLENDFTTTKKIIF